MSFTIDPAAMVVENYGHVLYGTKSTDVTDMSVNGVEGRITFPTGTSWRFETILEAGENSFAIRGKVGGVWSAATTVVLELPYFTQESHNNFNVFDNAALLIDSMLQRLPGEKNWEFRARMLSFAVAETGASLEGMFLAMAHQLGIKPEDQALGVKVARDVGGDLMSYNINLEITSVYVYIDADQLVQTGEAHRVPPLSLQITLDYPPRFADDVKIYNAEGDLVDENRYEVDTEEFTVTFKDDELAGQWVSTHYQYRWRVDHRDLTLAEVKAQLDAIQFGSRPMLSTVVTDGTLAAAGLQRVGRHLIDADDYDYTPHARVRIASLEDEEYQESLLNALGHAIDTDLEVFARRTRQKSDIGWDNLILDEGNWDVDADERPLDFLPRLFDAVFGRWRCKNPTCTEYYTLLDYKKYAGKCPTHPTVDLEYHGAEAFNLKSGPAETDSLYAGIREVEEEL